MQPSRAPQLRSPLLSDMALLRMGSWDSDEDAWNVWMTHFREWQDWLQTHDNVEPSRGAQPDTQEYKLARWVNNQRSSKADLPKRQFKALTSHSRWMWDYVEARKLTWNQRFDEWQEWYEDIHIVRASHSTV